jgi:FKBP-type peptidyl-prolyl cis-trans isomerase
MRRSVFLLVVLVACQKAGEDKPSQRPPHETGSNKPVVPPTHAGSGDKTAQPPGMRPKVQQISPPLDIKNPPADSTKTASGLIYKKLIVNDKGTGAKRNDTVLINYTGWRQSSGETFFSNRSRGQPMPLNLASTAPGFTEAMQLIRKGEKAVLWVPPSIGYKGTPQPGAETLVYEVEVIDVMPAPEIPTDLKGPPANAQTSKAGTKYLVVRPGTGKDRARSFDTVTFNYSAWDSDGRMFDSTEMRKRPATVPAYKQSATMEDMLTTMTAGQRVRFWIDADKMMAGKVMPSMPKGVLCYELEIVQIDPAAAAPPPPPPDVAKPPANTKKTAKGVFYRVLKAGPGGEKPKPTSAVKVHYTGWTTDGRMFDTSVIKGQQSEFRLDGVVAGWTDGLQTMSVGDRVRFWIPEELAYKGAPNKPQGMLVFDIELFEIKEPAKAGHHDSPHAPGGAQPPPTPPDVAGPPADAQKTSSGLAYKVLTAGSGGAKPTATSKVKVHYTGWQTTGGAPFDGSYKSGKPAEFAVNRVIKGWTEGLQLMSAGDKYRFWIPSELAYPNGGGPSGMLVFDVELLEIK